MSDDNKVPPANPIPILAIAWLSLPFIEFKKT
jgi:hypothetical protein